MFRFGIFILVNNFLAFFMGRVSAYFLKYKQIKHLQQTSIESLPMLTPTYLEVAEQSHGILSFCSGMMWDVFWDDPEMLNLWLSTENAETQTLGVLEWLQTQICFPYPSLNPEGISQLPLYFLYFSSLYLSYSVCLSCPWAFYPCARGWTTLLLS